MRVEGAQRKAVALGVLGALAATAWLTMDSGRPRWLVVILLCGFALRVLLASVGGSSQAEAGSRYDKSGSE